ncbi:MAG TPA: Uma2 family endonuclease [Chloroflexota bacterium]
MAIVEQPATATFTRRRWTRDEYYRMAEAGVFKRGERVELIDGEVTVMAPQNEPHMVATTLAAEALRDAFGRGFHVRVQGPMTLAGPTEPEPDVAVVEGSPNDYLASHPSNAAVVVEVAASSLAADRSEKSSLYARAGIPDYWIVNLVHRQLEVRHDPIALPSAPLGFAYRATTILLPGESVRPLARPDAEIAVDALLPRLG